MPEATPMFLTRDPVTGAVTFNFAGHIHATGLDLDASANSNPPDQDKIRWLSQSDGSVVATHYAYEAPHGQVNVSGITTANLNATGAVEARVTSNKTVNPSDVDGEIYLNTPSASVIVDSTKGVIGASPSHVTVGAGPQFKTLLDGNERSDFMQLDPASFKRARAQFGIGTVTFPGGSNDSNTNVINLSGGAGTFTQAYFFATSIEAAGNARFAYIVGPSVGSFGVRLNSVVGAPPAGTQEQYYWLAIQTQ